MEKLIDLEPLGAEWRDGLCCRCRFNNEDQQLASLLMVTVMDKNVRNWQGCRAIVLRL
jgi:hypothetical protein